MAQTLEPQQQLAHYRVTAPLGAGGPPPLRQQGTELRRGLAVASGGSDEAF